MVVRMMFYVLFHLFLSPVKANTIESYGDSLTAGMLSGTSAVEVSHFDSVNRILKDFASYIFTRDPRYISPHVRPDLAWPTHLAAFLSDPNHPIRVRNFARSGAKLGELLQQVAALHSQSGSTRAFFFIGHNDLCNQALSPDQLGEHFRQTYDRVLEEWDRKHRDAVAFILNVGEIHRLYETMDGHIWYRSVDRDFSCADSWTRLFPYCPAHYRKFRNNTLRTDLISKLQAIGDSLQDTAQSWEKRSRRNHYRFLESTEGITFERSYFALDCFHLSTRGQIELAQTILRRIR